MYVFECEHGVRVRGMLLTVMKPLWFRGAKVHIRHLNPKLGRHSTLLLLYSTTLLQMLDLFYTLLQPSSFIFLCLQLLPLYCPTLNVLKHTMYFLEENLFPLSLVHLYLLPIFLLSFIAVT